MKTNTSLRNVEILIAFIFGLSISVWKPGIYVSSAAVLIWALVLSAVCTDYRQRLWHQKITQASLGLFLLGILTSWLDSGQASDSLLFARKGMFLLLAGPLLILFSTPQNRKAGLIGLMLGVWVTTVLTLNKAGWQFRGSRIAGTWTVDVLGVAMGLITVFLTPLLFTEPDRRWRILLRLTWLAAFITLIFTGARGPWLATGIFVVLYLVLWQRKVLFISAIVAVLAIWPVQHFAPQTVDSVTQRISSMQSIQTDASNHYRFLMWQLGAAFIADKWTHNQTAFWFGSGPKNHLQALKPFFDKTDALPDADKALLAKENYPGNDLHNMYVDTLSKMGVLWTTLTLMFFIWIALTGWYRRPRRDQQVLSGILTLGAFLVIGVFYDLLLTFSAYFMMYLMTLGIQSTSNRVAASEQPPATDKSKPSIAA